MGQYTSTPATPKLLDNMDIEFYYCDTYDTNRIIITVEEKSRVEFVRKLIQANFINMYHYTDEQTYMDEAIARLDLPMIKMLLEENFDPNFIKSWRTPIEELCKHAWNFFGNRDIDTIAPILEAFLEAGADFTILGQKKIPVGEVVLTCENGKFAKRPDIIQVLIKSGMNLDKFKDNPLIAPYLEARDQAIDQALSTDQVYEPGLTKLTTSYL